MIRIKFSDEDIQRLNHERYHYPHPQVGHSVEVRFVPSERAA